MEKPLAVSREQIEEIRCAYQAEKEKGLAPFLMVGYNRRFAPFTGKVRQFFAGRQEPMVAHIRVNAGFIPGDHWVQKAGEGGRIVGELCHFVDWARCLVGRSVIKVSATALPDGTRYNRDNVVVTLTFQDGSLANLSYLANGDRSVAKEEFEVFCEGKVARISDFSTIELSSDGKTRRTKARRDKGHEQEIAATIEAIKTGGDSPIPFEELIEVSEATLAIEEAAGSGTSVSLQPRQVSEV